MSTLHPFNKALLASATVAALVISSGVAFASDSTVTLGTSTQATVGRNDQSPVPVSTLSATQIATLQLTVSNAKATYIAAVAKLKTDQTSLFALQKQYQAELKAAQAKALADAHLVLTPIDSPKPSETPNPGDGAGSTQVASPAVAHAKATLLEAYNLLNTDRTAVSVAEKASKSSPTDASLLATLVSARAKVAVDLTAYNTDKQALNALLNVAPQHTISTVPPIHPETTAPPSAPSIISDPKIKTAQDLVLADYKALNDARAAVSVAEKASKANPTDATLLATLVDARAKATVALNIFNADKQALSVLVKTSASFTHSDTAPSSTPAHLDALPSTTLPPTTTDPVLKAAQDLVAADYKIFTDAHTAVSVAEQASKASPTDATLSATLATARVNANAAGLALSNAQHALKVLVASENASVHPTASGNSDHGSPQTNNGVGTGAKPNPGNGASQSAINAVLEATTKTFIAAHPDLATAQALVVSDTAAVKSAGKALSDAQVALKVALHGSEAVHPTPTTPVPTN